MAKHDPSNTLSSLLEGGSTLLAGGEEGYEKGTLPTVSGKRLYGSEYAALTIGSRIKKNRNEDGVLARVSGKYVLLAVADGVGGLPESGKASEAVINSLSTLDLSSQTNKGLDTAVYRALADACKNMPEEGASTVSAVVIWQDAQNNGHGRFYHMGDGVVVATKHNPRHLEVITKFSAWPNGWPFWLDSSKTLPDVRKLVNAYFQPGENGTDALIRTPHTFGVMRGDILLLSTDGLLKYFERPDYQLSHLVAGKKMPTAAGFMESIRAAAGRPDRSGVMDDLGIVVYQHLPSREPK
ncbi:protein phosphatase 2C domain-containing protein [Candidatus Woesearchaeota archaeon]|nr:protein phosphatase 2C domain-containing protein [Candidatus Woesearchaeota archaeon]